MIRPRQGGVVSVLLPSALRVDNALLLVEDHLRAVVARGDAIATVGVLRREDARLLPVRGHVL